MKWLKVSIAFLICLAAVPLLSCTGKFGKPELSVYLDVAINQEGHWLTAKFQNIGQSGLTIWESGFWPNTLLLCVDEQGKRPPTTVEGQRLLKAFEPGGARDKNVLISLEPFQVHNGDPILLERVFVLEPSTTYFVRVLYEERAENGWSGRAESNKVRIMPSRNDFKR